MKTINVGLIGAGTIGKGVIEAFIENQKSIFAKTGVDVVLKTVCDRDENMRNEVRTLGDFHITADAYEVINDETISIVIELIGGINPAKELILSAIKKKKHVVTANKALISENWKEIFSLANQHKVAVGFEASVGGGIPVIKTLRESFVANNIQVIYGILNGTTNFILTTMAEHGSSFEQALLKAQKKGIAESNPGLDISGKDSAYKLSILSMISFGVAVSPDEIYTEGIEDITPQDIKYAEKLGYSIKLLAIAKKNTDSLQLRVHPTLISSGSLLANVKGEDNAIFIKGDFVGESLLYGKGAGRRPTASSVMSDVLEIAESVACGCAIKPNKFVFSDEPAKIVNLGELDICYYLRFSVIDKPGVLAKIASILAEHNISISGMSQEERKRGQSVPVIMLTHNAEEGEMRKAINTIDQMEVVTSKTVVIRIEG
ncbi:MAG: homoserine dehydrogenase [Candidatus Omnitrophica bacterium]|nr:homoserine dehydrogenase [Candidatus Omnitrophota bacterium]